MSLHALKSCLANETVKKRAEKEMTILRSFEVNQEVIKRIPGLHACLEASCHGPFVITEKVPDVN